MKEALIIFVKNPIIGKVKTRLAAKVGDEKALQIYLELLAHTRSIVNSVAADKFIFYSDAHDNNDLWPNTIYNKKNQLGNNLGERMHNAFNELFAAGYQKVFIIGSDCLELNAAIINQGSKELETSDVVIGPARDGGYYFLGMKKIHTALFENIDWSTEKVLTQTIAVCDNKQFPYTLLPVLNDIDEEADWLKALEQFSL